MYNYAKTLFLVDNKTTQNIKIYYVLVIEIIVIQEIIHGI